MNRNLLLVSLSLIPLFSAARADEADEKILAIQESIAARGAKWRAEKTPFFTLSSDKKRLLCGAREDPQAAARLPHFRPSQNRKQPLRLDWRANGGNFVTPVRNQGGCGSCWAFAATAVFESMYLIESDQPGLDADRSEQDIVSCSGGGNCQGGFADMALQHTVSTGIVDEACFPYAADDRPCSEKCSDWRERVLRSHRVLYVENTQVETLKAALLEGPITMCFTVYEDFFAYTGGVYEHVWGEAFASHAVAVVGYDDADSAWIVKNSWGDGFGEKGYFRYRYGQDFGCPYTLQKNRAPVFEPLYTHTAREGELMEFYVHATDPDGDEVVYGMEAPAELAAATLDPQSGLFRWIPPAGSLGVYRVRFTASDVWTPSASSSAEIPISVCTSACDDGNPCTDDTCPAGACQHEPNSRFCPDDGEFCTDDQCREGSCYRPLPDHSACPDDGSECSEDECLQGLCRHPPLADGTPCSDDGSFCTQDFCGDGLCLHQPLADGTLCDDGARCTSPDLCLGGLCRGKLPEECVDGHGCTMDWCVDDRWVFRELETDFADISSSGQDLGLDGDDVALGPFAIGFDFHAASGGPPKSEFWVSSNGLLTFSGPSLAWEGYCPPAPMEPLDFLAPYWTDLECRRAEGCRVHTQLSGEEPLRELTIQWSGARLFGQKESHLTFQAVLREAGGFEFRYGILEGSGAARTVIGWAAEDGATGAAFSCDFPSLEAGRALLFVEDGWHCESYPEKGSCLIQDGCYSDGETNPANPCLVCRAWENNFDWSSNEGAPCDDGQGCSGEDFCWNGVCTGTPPGECADDLKCTVDGCLDQGEGYVCRSDLYPGFCLIEGECHWQKETNPNNPCQACRPEFDARGWSPSEIEFCDDADPCTWDDRCRQGACRGIPYQCPAGPCVALAACDGAGGCHYQWLPDLSECSRPLCQDGWLTPAGTCRAGECVAGEPRPCEPFACLDETACRTDCQEDAHCQAGYFCDAVQGVCLPKRPSGSACSAPGECLSGHCQNGFCCLGGDCCSTAADCPDGYLVAPVCDFPPGCQGHRGEKFCSALSSCQTLPVEDDSGCSADFVFECRGEKIACNGESVQEENPCLVRCQKDSDCSTGEFCRQGVCQQLPPENRPGEGGCGCSSGSLPPAAGLLSALCPIVFLLRRPRLRRRLFR